jgi:hypothetical protein
MTMPVNFKEKQFVWPKGILSGSTYLESTTRFILEKLVNGNPDLWQYYWVTTLDVQNILHMEEGVTYKLSVQLDEIDNLEFIWPIDSEPADPESLDTIQQALSIADSVYCANPIFHFISDKPKGEKLKAKLMPGTTYYIRTHLQFS